MPGVFAFPGKHKLQFMCLVNLIFFLDLFVIQVMILNCDFLS